MKVRLRISWKTHANVMTPHVMEMEDITREQAEQIVKFVCLVTDPAHYVEWRVADYAGFLDTTGKRHMSVIDRHQ